MNLVQKIISNHLLEGELKAGVEIKIKVDQTLTQDTTGTMAYLQLLALDVPKIQTEFSIAYIDHNLLQVGFENADDHEFIKSVALKHGVVYSKAGSGICHQVHLERFAAPGKTLIGADSHTPTAGGIGSLAIGAGGLDVAIGMAKGYYYLKMPKVLNIILHGHLNPYVSAKDVILYILKKLTVKGGVGKIIEYSGPGVANLSVTERATITNMGAELGATTSIFPADDITKEFLIKQKREQVYLSLQADLDAQYDDQLEIDLTDIEPLVALPHSPDNVHKVSDITVDVNQVAIGSCTNSSYEDMMTVAEILKGKKIHKDVSLVISPGSSNILKMLSQNGALAHMINAGARILESGCGPCIGMGQAPKTGGVSLRTMNRNFKGRSGTEDAKVYLVSPETAAYSALKGALKDPRKLGDPIEISHPTSYDYVDNYFIYPTESDYVRKVEKGPNIKSFPIGKPLESTIDKKVILKLHNNVTTDDITPSNANLLPFRSNIPYLAKFCFKMIAENFYETANKYKGGIIVGGHNYGQGSSREHAALIPLYLGVKAVIAKSFARIHKTNLVNAGILPLVFQSEKDYDQIDVYDDLVVNTSTISSKVLTIVNKSKNIEFKAIIEGSTKDIDTLLLGGTINYIKESNDA